MKKHLLILFLALPLAATTTNYVQVTGTVMQGQDREFSTISATNLACATGGLVTNLDPQVYVTAVNGPTFGGGGGIGGHSIYKLTYSNLVYVSELQTCTNSHHYLLWLMANTNVFSDLGITPAADGDLIVQQNDQSGHGYNVIGGTAHQPMFITNAANSHPAVRFQTGGDNALDNTAVTNGQPIIVYMVLQITNVDSPGNSILWASDNASGSMRVAMNSSYAISMVATAPGGGSYTQIDGAALFPTNRFNLITCIFNGAASSLRQNGVQIASGTMHNSGLGGIAIQGDFAAPDDLEEFIVDTDPSQVSGTEAYLTAKYGL